MGNKEAETPSKPEKASSPAQEQSNVPAYPEWANIQAYYGPGVTMPPSYFNSTVTTGHPPPPYMWGPPQALMPPYGVPYPIYPHGGIYAHPAVPYGSHGHGLPPSPGVSEVMVATPLGVEPAAKSSTSKEGGLMKKLKGFDGLAVSIGNDNAENGTGGSIHGISQSGECGTEGSSGGSDGNTGGDKSHRKRNCGGTSYTGLELSASPNGNVKSNSGTAHISPGVVLPGRNGLPCEPQIQKRERRKQSNRESARRSRLRKQAETEELAVTVEELTSENIALRSEINQLTENSQKLRLENAALMEKLNNAHLEVDKDMAPDNVDSAEMRTPDSTENLLSRVNNLGSVRSEPHENSDSSTKFHQLLKSSPRADAVAAG